MSWVPGRRPGSKNRFSLLFQGLLPAILFCAVAGQAQDPGQRMPADGPPIPGRGIILTIDGRVVGSDGSNVAGARVMLRDNRGGIRGVIYTRDGGSFQFTQVAPGRYTLTVWHDEYREHTETIDLISSSVIGLNVWLERRYSSALPLQPTVAAWALAIPQKAEREFNRGLDSLGRGDAKGTIRHMQKAIAIYPQFAAAYAALGAAQQDLKQNDAAAQAFEKAIEIDDMLHSAWLGLGILHAVAHRYKEAERHLLQARSLSPDDWQAWYQLGELYWEMGDAIHTEENVRRALELRDSMPRIHVLLINSLVKQEKYSDALAAMETFLAKFPESPLAPEVAGKRDLLRAELKRTAP